MQQIERVGVIALLLMVVTIVVVALWDDGDESAGKRAAVEERPREARQERPARRAVDPADRLHATRATERQRTTAPVTTRIAAGIDDGGVPEPSAGSRTAGAAQGSSRAARSVVLDPPDRSRRSTPSTVPPPASGHSVADGIQQLERQRNEARRAADPEPEPPQAVPVALSPQPANASIAGARAAAAASGIYVVEKGDTLEGIARRVLGEGKRWRELQALNGGVDPKKLWVGKKLRLPAGAAPESRGDTPPSRASSKPVNTRTYVVQAGDILGRIAQRELGSARHWKKIADLNPKVDPDRLLVGTRLVLPDIEPDAEPRSSLMAQAAPAGGDPFRVR